MFYKTSHYLIYTTKTTPCSYKKNYPKFLFKKKNKINYLKKKREHHYMHKARVMRLVIIIIIIIRSSKMIIVVC